MKRALIEVSRELVQDAANLECAVIDAAFFKKMLRLPESAIVMLGEFATLKGDYVLRVESDDLPDSCVVPDDSILKTVSPTYSRAGELVGWSG